MRGWNRFVYLIISTPSLLLSVLYERLPTKDRTGWVKWIGARPRDSGLISLRLSE